MLNVSVWVVWAVVAVVIVAASQRVVRNVLKFENIINYFPKKINNDYDYNNFFYCWQIDKKVIGLNFEIITLANYLKECMRPDL